MRTSSITEKRKKSLKRGKTMFFIIASIMIVNIILLIVFGSEENARMILVVFFGILFYVFMGSLIGLLKYISATNLISINQFHEYDESKITVYDKTADANIENEFNWRDIKYIEQIDFRSGFDVLLGYEYIGLMLIADKEQFYKGINPKNKEMDKIQKRQTKLSGGFFFQCTREDIDAIQRYWGKEIKNN